MSHRLRDVWVIYPSANEPGKFVAHSLYTDQIGVAECVLNAYVELCRAVQTLLCEARRDARVKVFQPAPDEVWRMLEEARPLPREIAEFAHRMLHGRRPPRVAIPAVRKPRVALPPKELVLT